MSSGYSSTGIYPEPPLVAVTSPSTTTTTTTPAGTVIPIGMPGGGKMTDPNGNPINNSTSPPLLPPIDLSKLSESDRTQLRQSLLQQIQDKINEYNKMTRIWRSVYWSLGLIALLSNVLVVALSGASISTLSASDQTASQVLNIVNTVLGALGLIAMSLNSYLQSYMNATYFAEAAAKYKELQLIVWTDLAIATARFDQLNQKYDTSGVGSIVNLESMQSKSMSKDVYPLKTYPKRYAVPRKVRVSPVDSSE